MIFWGEKTNFEKFEVRIENFVILRLDFWFFEVRIQLFEVLKLEDRFWKLWG